MNVRCSIHFIKDEGNYSNFLTRPEIMLRDTYGIGIIFFFGPRQLFIAFGVKQVVNIRCVEMMSR